MLFPPLIIMLLVTGTALAERTIGLVKAIAAGSATFLVEGLQLIIAILLIILDQFSESLLRISEELRKSITI